MKKRLLTILFATTIAVSLTACSGLKLTPPSEVNTEETKEDEKEDESSHKEKEDSGDKNKKDKIKSDSKKEDLTEIGNDYFGHFYLEGEFVEVESDYDGLIYKNKEDGTIVSIFRHPYLPVQIKNQLQDSLSTQMVKVGGSEEVTSKSLNKIGYDEKGYVLEGIMEIEDDEYVVNSYIIDNGDGSCIYFSIENQISYRDIREDMDEIICYFEKSTEDVDSYIKSEKTESETNNTETSEPTPSPSTEAVENERESHTMHVDLNYDGTDETHTVYTPNGYVISPDSFSDTFVIMEDAYDNMVTSSMFPSSVITQYLKNDIMPDGSDYGAEITVEVLGGIVTSKGTFVVVEEETYYTEYESTYREYFAILEDETLEINVCPSNDKEFTLAELEKIVLEAVGDR